MEPSKGPDAAARIHRDVVALFKFTTGDGTDLPRSFKPWLLTFSVPPLSARKLRRPNLPQCNREVLPMMYREGVELSRDVCERRRGVPEDGTPSG